MVFASFAKNLNTFVYTVYHPSEKHEENERKQQQNRRPFYWVEELTLGRGAVSLGQQEANLVGSSLLMMSISPSSLEM
ncbi:hypothetical protein AAC387_Pa03g3214 [Persea americana]